MSARAVGESGGADHGSTPVSPAHHIYRENGVLFPIAEQILAEEAQRVLVQAFDAVEQEVMGPGIRERLVVELETLERGR